MFVDPATMPDRGGIVPVPFRAHERLMIRQQAKNDRRAIPQIWLWRLLRTDCVRKTEGESTPEFPEEGASIHEFFAENADVPGGSVYHEPIAVHLYVDWSAEVKERKNPVTETTGSVRLWISRAEARRIGALVSSYDDDENLVTAQEGQAIINGERHPRPGELEPIFVPRNGDVFRFRDRYHRVDQMENGFLGATEIPTHWEGYGHVLRENATAPGMMHLPPPPTFSPSQLAAGC